MFYHDINPVIIKLGIFEIRYYGLFFFLCFIIAYYMIRYLSKKRNLNLSMEDIDTFILYELVGIILFARLFYVFVYNFNYYYDNPLEIIALWHGGLSFHGGLIGAIILGIIFCKRKNISFLELADIVVLPLSIGLMLGRIANFINGELVGRITTMPWGVKFSGYEGFRHPSQLYESFKNLVIFGILWSLKDRKLPKGCLFFLFLILYSSMRFFIEFFREPDIQLGFIGFGLTMGQILNIIMFFSAIILSQKIFR